MCECKQITRLYNDFSTRSTISEYLRVSGSRNLRRDLWRQRTNAPLAESTVSSSTSSLYLLAGETGREAAREASREAPRKRLMIRLNGVLIKFDY